MYLLQNFIIVDGLLICVGVMKLILKIKRLIKKKAYDEALELCNSLISNDTQEADIYRSRALVLSSMKDFPAAIADMDSAIALNNKEPSFYYSRAIYFLKASQFSEANRDFDLTLKLGKENDFEYYTSSCFYHKAYIAAERGDINNVRQLLANVEDNSFSFVMGRKVTKSDFLNC